jgi:hypothetical protein
MEYHPGKHDANDGFVRVHVCLCAPVCISAGTFLFVLVPA